MREQTRWQIFRLACLGPSAEADSVGAAAGAAAAGTR